MTKFVCTVCGYTAEGDEPPAVCPVCGAPAALFTAMPDSGSAAPKDKSSPNSVPVSYPKDMTARELSACFSSLANGCDKQQKPVERDCFNELSAYYQSFAEKTETPSFATLKEAAEADLSIHYPRVKAAASDANDRGALRALVWSEKVTMIHQVLLSRYEREGDTMFKGQNIYVCPVCGFISVGTNPPEKCPVCSVPPWKFETISGGA